MKRRQQGQEALEFALIGGLVFVVSLGVVVVFGEKLAGFFNNNPASTLASHSTPVVSETDFVDFKDHTLVTYAENPTPTEKIEINGETFDISSEVIQAIEAAGSPGIEDFVSQVAYLQEIYPDEEIEYSITNIDIKKKIQSMGEDHRINLDFGSSVSCIWTSEKCVEWVKTKNSNVDDVMYTGTAEIEVKTNTMMIKAGDKIIILEKEVGCNDKGTGLCASYPADQYIRIEGDINSNNVFKGKATSLNDKYVIDSIYETKINADEGLVFDSAKMYDPLIEKLKRMMDDHSYKFQRVIKNLDKGNNRNYTNDTKQEIKELILAVRAKYGDQYDITVDKEGITGLLDDPILLGVLEQSQGISFEENIVHKLVKNDKEEDLAEDDEIKPQLEPEQDGMYRTDEESAYGGGSSSSVGGGSSGGGGGGHAAEKAMKSTE